MFSLVLYINSPEYLIFSTSTLKLVVMQTKIKIYSTLNLVQTKLQATTCVYRMALVRARV